MSTAWAQGGAVRAKQDLEALAKELDVKHPGAAASLHEGLEQTLTVQKLGLPAQLRRGLRTTKCDRGPELTAPRHRPSHLALHHRRSGSALGSVAALRVEPRLYRIAGYSHLPILAQALEVYASRLDEATARAS